MTIETAQWANQQQTAVLINGTISVPWPCQTWHREAIEARLAAGNVINEPQPSPYHALVDGAWVLDRDAAAAVMWERIKEHRDRLKSGGVLVDGYWFHSDDPSRIQQLGLVLMGANLPAFPAGIMWKTLSGAFVEMTPELATKIFNTLVQTDTTNFAVAEQHRLAMEQVDDPLAYDYSAGWLLVYEEGA